MVLFLNFTPIEYMGGTEKWMNDAAKKITKYEDAQIISIHARIANYYGRFVHKKMYMRYAKKTDIHNHTSLDILSFLPFTKHWMNARKKFSNSRIIYTKYEILELLIIFYFLGYAGLKKTIVGIHSPFIYKDPQGFFDKLHNLIYGSRVYRFIFSHIKRIHVLNENDKEYFQGLQKLKNVTYVPNGVEPYKPTHKIITNKNLLNVLFAGELSLRKGIDTLISIIRESPPRIKFTVAGDGPLKKDIQDTALGSNNLKYVGYSNKQQLKKLFLNNDALILPSRAESMSLAVLEAMSHGLVIIDSTDTMLNLDKKVEYPGDNKNIETYTKILGKLSSLKNSNKIDRSYIINYFNKNFSSAIIDEKLSKKVFELKEYENRISL